MSDPPERPNAGFKRSRVDLEPNNNPASSAAAAAAAAAFRQGQGISSTSNTNNNAARILQTGNFGAWLAKIAENPAQDGHEIFGSLPAVGTPSFQTLQLIANFLAQHHLAEAASKSGGGDGDNNNNNNPSNSSPRDQHISTAPYYLPTLKEFAHAQLDRQAAGLGTNASRETAAGVTQLIEDHSNALQVVLAAEQTTSSLLSNETICLVHRRLCPTLPVSGRYRTSRARAGQTFFCPPENISREMDLFWTSMQKLEQQYIHSSNRPPDITRDISKLYFSIAMAATAMYAINDIHPFADGNGRTSRIYANGLLKQLLQLPFTITIAATPQQRQEYVDGLRNGHRRIIIDQNNTNTSATSTTTNSPGVVAAVMQPLIQMLMERIAHAVAQVQSLLTERARAAVDEEEARIARRVRERAAQGQCIICLDASPNIATLCCGQAVHLNCIAEWLANGTTCVNCRNPLPRLSVANNRQPGAAAAPQNAGGDMDNLHEAFQAMQDAVQRAIELQNNMDGVQQNGEDFTTNTTTSVHDDDEESTTTTAVGANAPPLPPTCPNCQNRSAIDCDNGMCGRCCGIYGGGSCPRHGTIGGHQNHADTTSTVDDDQDTTTTTVAPAPPPRPQCHRCNNIMAVDCDNQMCAQCCGTYGNDPCNRHGTAGNRASQIEDTTTTTTTTDDDATNQASDECPTCSNISAFGCTNHMCGRCCPTLGAHTCERHDPPQPQPDEDTSSTTTTSTVQQAPSSQPTYCDSCSRNRAALDCANHMCGRCCVLSGLTHRCNRHGGM